MLPLISNLVGRYLAEPRLERLRSFNDERAAIVAETVQRVAGQKRGPTGDLELVLNDVCFHEEQRFRSQGRLSEEDQALKERFRRLQRGLRRMSPAELDDTLGDLVHWYASDVVGNFNPAVFAVATRLAPLGLAVLLSPLHRGRPLRELSELNRRILIEGPLDALRTLSQRGTLVVVPTHLSNLDSIVVGSALEQARLPPVTYGAGKNLFSNPLLSFFMRNLGAYRVDRRVRHTLYKDVLKAYSTVLLERGYHSLFFPGGTRARSGAIETKLKLGLAGTAIDATIHLMQRGGGRPIYFVPATLNYQLVLEASTLIEDYLKEAGKSRYIIDDDESTQFGRVMRYLADMVRAEGTMTIHFGDPLDVLGHHVSPDGSSHDERGRAVDLRPFFTIDGEVRTDAARDAEYTRELGEKITAAFHADTHLQSTQLVAFVLFRLLMRRGGSDLFRVLRGTEITEGLPCVKVLEAIERVKRRLETMAAAGRVRLGRKLREPADAILREALGFFALFHVRPAAQRIGDDISVEDRPLCYYYHNRLTGYGLETEV